MSSPGTTIARLGHRPHRLDRKKYGQPYVALFACGNRFERPGLYVWLLTRNLRIPGTRRLGSRFDA